MTHYGMAIEATGVVVETFRPHVSREQAQAFVDAASKWTGPIGKRTTKYKLVELTA